MSNVLNKNVTSKINWCLENILPPFMREWSWLMYWIIYPAYGNKTKYVMGFRDKYPFMTQREIEEYYSVLADAPINKKRRIDLTSRGIKFVLDHIVGRSVLDAACGRGLLAECIFRAGEGTKSVTGLDIVIPDKNTNFGLKDIELKVGNLQELMIILLTQ